jgi:transcriptional regulator with XRE-family HTH domain
MPGIKALRDYRTTKNLTQEALAAQLGVTSVTLSRWETGYRRIDKALLIKISELTGIATKDLRPDLADLMGAAE